MKKTLFVGLVLVFSVSGCAVLPGAGVVSIPSQTISDASIRLVAEKFENPICEQAEGPNSLCPTAGLPRLGSWMDVINKCGLASPGFSDCEERRNNIIGELLLVVDHNYSAYEGNVVAGNAKGNFYTNGLRTSLETAATIFTPASTVKILTGTAALSGALQESASKEFYFDRTIHALIAQMRADRKKIIWRILSQLQNKDYTEYPLPIALRDVDALYRAGTIASATTAIASNAAAEEATADDEIQKLAQKK